MLPVVLQTKIKYYPCFASGELTFEHNYTNLSLHLKVFFHIDDNPFYHHVIEALTPKIPYL